MLSSQYNSTWFINFIRHFFLHNPKWHLYGRKCSLSMLTLQMRQNFLQFNAKLCCNFLWQPPSFHTSILWCLICINSSSLLEVCLLFHSGCELSLEWGSTRYANVITNPTLADLYQANAETFGIILDSVKPEGQGSTDMGNVSHIVPSTHVLYSIGSTAVNHSHAFTAAAITEVAHQKTLIASKAMAMTAIDVVCKPELMEKVKNDFAKSHATSSWVVLKWWQLEDFPSNGSKSVMTSL